MQKRIKIGQIYIDLTYEYDEYFSETIDAYVTDDVCPSPRHLSIETRSRIDVPDRPVTFTYKNRIKMANDKDTYLVTYSGKSVRHMIYYTNDFREIRIILSDHLAERCAEFEYVLSGMMFFEMALKEGYLPVHASCVSYHGKTFLLSGPSKSGKSTQTRFFIETFPESMIINEDKPLVFFENHKPFVIGSPWSGKHVINKNIKQPIDYIFFVQKDNSLEIRAMSRKEKMTHLFRNIHRPGDEDLVHKMAGIVTEMLSQIPMFQFHCINQHASANYLFQFMEEYHED